MARSSPYLEDRIAIPWDNIPFCKKYAYALCNTETGLKALALQTAYCRYSHAGSDPAAAATGRLGWPHKRVCTTSVITPSVPSIPLLHNSLVKVSINRVSICQR